MTTPHINLRFIGRVSVRLAIVVMLVFSTPIGQRMLDRVGVVTHVSDLRAIKTDVADIKNQLTALVPDVAELKSLADVPPPRTTAANENPSRSFPPRSLD